MKTKTLLAALGCLTLLLSRASAQVTVTTVSTNGFNEPYGIAVDAGSNLYITDGGNNRIVKIDSSTQTASTLAGIPSDPPDSNDGPAYLAHFNNPQGILLVTLNGISGLLVSDYGNNLIRFVRLSDGYVTTIAGQVAGGPAVNAAGLNATFRYPLGMDQDTNGTVYIADFGNNAIRLMNLNDPNLGVTNLVITGTTLYRPTAVAFVSPNQLWVADTGNQMVKLFTLTSSTTATLTSAVGGYRTVGTTDSSFGANARFNGPSGLLWLPNIGLLISDELNNTIRLATNYTAFGATNYAVSTYAGTAGQSGLVDGAALSSKLNSPIGLGVDLLNNGFVIADLKNNAIRRIQTSPPQPPVPAPQIGWVLFVKDQFGDYVSQLQVGSSFVFNNDVVVAILGTDGTETHFTFGPTPIITGTDTIPTPSPTVGSTPGVYRDGVHQADVPPSIISPQPDLTVKAIGFEAGRVNSPVVSARFVFRAAAPFIQGNNAAQFTVTEQTLGALLWYTTDGSDPTNASPSIGPISASASGVTLSIPAPTNFTFKIRAFRDSYQPSEIVSQNFSATNFTANKISLGFASGEASSDFVASPGQFFYSPITLSILQNTKIYSLQFNVTVTNAGPNPGPAVAPGAVNFVSFLEKPNPNPPNFIIIPPAMFLGLTVTNTVGTNTFGTYPVDPPPTNLIFNYNGQAGYLGLQFTNSSENLIGVGWLERLGKTNLYDTTKQDLIKYSQPHDTLFDEQNGLVVAGGHGFQVPSNAVAGQTYQVQVGRPSATSDGVGAPGSDVYIATPTNGSLAGGAINATKIVTVGQRKYIAGDSAPFRWFNAGDFGNTNLDNSDVMQVFQSAVYLLDSPPPFSDFFDSMDSCGTFGITDPATGLLVPNYNKAIDPDAIFDGDDQTINQIAFGDGNLDTCDIYVTFRRSLDPSLIWFRRFWTNGIRAAEIVGNPPPPQTLIAHLTNRPSVAFVGGDAIGSAGQTMQIPISAQVLGTYPMRVLALNITVNPLDGSPALTSSVQFTPNPVLGQPTLTASRAVGNYAAAWLNSSIAGLSSNATVGTLSFQIPSNAPSSAAYAIHFDHASASPNGLASFPKKTQTGLVTLSDRSGSTYNDGIPDSWRLRYFGTVNNLLSQAAADADGDGMNNWQEYVAGTDPTDANSVLKVSSAAGSAPQSQDCAIRWPSVSGKQYIIERSASLFSPVWVPVTTNVGTGANMEFHDTTGGNLRFYRVRVQ